MQVPLDTDPDSPVRPGYRGDARTRRGEGASLVVVTFTVNGEPAPQGSKTVGRTNWGRSFVREDNPATAPWRNAVAAAGVSTMGDLGRTPFGGPVRLEVWFRFARPRSHYGKGRNVERLKPSAPRTYCARKPDVDKLVRAVGDALTGVVLVDDSKVVELIAVKLWGAPGATIRVTEVEA